MDVKVTADRSGQEKKSAILRALPKAYRKNATEWAGDTIRHIKQNYRGGGGSFAPFKRPPKEIDQNLGFIVQTRGASAAQIVLGTGAFVGRKEVVYALIQEEGGTILGKPWLTVPFSGVKGRITDYPGGFFFTSKKGNLIYSAPVKRANRGKVNPSATSAIYGKKGQVNEIRPLYVLKKQVTLPARRWFSRPIKERLPALNMAMAPDTVWATARAMSAGYVRGTGG